MFILVGHGKGGKPCSGLLECCVIRDFYPHFQWVVRPSTHPLIYLFIYPSTHWPIHQFIYLLTHTCPSPPPQSSSTRLAKCSLFLQPCSYPPFPSFTYNLSIHAPHHPFICLCNCSLIHSLTRSFIVDPLRCIHPHIPTPTPSVDPFEHPSLCIRINLLSIYLQINLFVHQSICPSILLSLYSFFRHRLRTCSCHTLEGWKFVLGDTQIKNSFPTPKSA